MLIGIGGGAFYNRGMGSDHIGNSTSRLIVLRVPVRKRGLLFLFPCIFLGVIGVGIAMLITGSLVPDPGLFWILFVTIPSAVAGAILPAILMDRLRDRWALAEPNWRSERLQRVLLHPQGKGRLPHRWAENELRGVVMAPGRLKRIVKTLPAGAMVMAVDRKIYPVEKPFPWDGAFDPVRIGEEDNEDRLVDMANEILEEKRAEGIDSQGDHPSGIFQARGVSWGALIGGIAWALFFSCQAVKRIVEGKPWDTRDWFGLLLLIAAFALPAYFGLIARRTWYLIPTGFFCDCFRIWNRESQLTRYTRRDSAFLFYQPLSLLALARDGVGRVFNITQPGAWVAMATWMGNAEAPSVEQLRGLFAERGEERGSNQV